MLRRQARAAVYTTDGNDPVPLLLHLKLATLRK
jgi:hypothetical protein